MAKTAAAKTDDAKTAGKTEAKSASKASSAKASGGASEKSAKAKPAKSKTAGKSADGGSKGARTDGIHAKVTPSKELGEIVGADALPRSEVVSKIWTYIRSNKLQDPADGRNILADDKLEAIFGKKKVTMFELNKIISGHLTK